jgi:mannitol/fructose-specific phosphotransferase system IIA component (Ntr-type)
MSLANLLSAEQIIPEMKAAERWPAIVELIDLLVSLGKIKPEDRDSILASLKQREETMSTGIGFGMPFPIARRIGSKRSWPHLEDRRAGSSSTRLIMRR